MTHPTISSLTPREELHLFGKLCESTLEEVLEAAERVDKIDSAIISIEEGMTQYPAEDSLDQEGIIQELRELASRMRGDNKATLQSIIEKLDNYQLAQFNAGEYGKEQLQEAIKELSE